MKKLFFSALLAVVAVGGAFAINAKPDTIGNFYSKFTTGLPDIFCTAGLAVCSMYYSPPAYDSPADYPIRIEVNLSNYEHAL